MSKQLQIPGIGGGVMPGELIVDLFAGGGGASRGIEEALGRPPDIAINHDPQAIQMHESNHPATTHHCQSVFHRDVHPLTLVHGMDPHDLPRYVWKNYRRFKYDRAAPVGERLTQRVGLLWLSPDCRHFSKARGAAPVSPSVRALCWVGLRWVKFTRPRVMILENVEEFTTAGPLLADNTPNPARKGEHFRAFVRELERYGYTVEWRVLKACDFGAPTIRKRLFLVARCDGEPIKWPEPTHGPKRAKPYRSAAEVIDFTIPCPSIFLTPAEAKALGVKRPLAPATCRRIAAGLVRFVLTAANPFIIKVCHGEGDSSRRIKDIREPLGTTTSTNDTALVSPSVVRIGQTGWGDGGKVSDVRDPLTTVTAKAEHCLMAPHLAAIGERHGGGNARVDQPMGTLLTTERHAVVSAFIAKHYDQPGGNPLAGAPITDPLPTMTTKACQINAVACHLEVFRQNRAGADIQEPVPTLTSGGGKGGGTMALVAAFLVHYYGTGGQSQDLREPLATIVSRARTGLVTVTVEGQEYAVVDIGMRMLTPEELAAAQGFPSSYILTGTKAEKIKRIGNSVCPPVAAAMVAANIPRPQRLRKGAA